ncbi:MBL fold metallo-hydrolase [Acidocella sp.]|uniref:MBL fold metallo-hydrolase n=1 Tax=Acidocella sp. TaxID=50710 RepID=UPI003CFC36EF
MLRLLKARMSRDQANWARWPSHVENTPYPPPDPAQPSITWIGHSSFLLCLEGLNVLTDPVFSERCSPVRFAGPKRVRDPGLSIDALPRIDLILLSHNHYDHMDILSLRHIHRRFPMARIVTSLGNASFLKRQRLPGAVELDWWDHVTVHGIHVTATPARHFAARTLWDRNKTLWAGFMLNYRGRKLYFAGDSGYTKFFGEIHYRLGAPDLALLPIGAYAPREMMASVHMDPVEAVRAFQDLHAQRAIGMHFGTFQLTSEPIDAPEMELELALAQANIPPERFFTLDVGQTTWL